ncbi:MAG TPA: NADH-quinone oxidoreductase subunit NuoK [Candidatus Binatia bacterium]|jgi:NADH:ubiquinone oxidoreductase subunit K|nr:NADH-quinone oxidoreductase subunit NuoK [Candidatus Binatia bacterium]HEU4637532.1 NADH-quinone oxidoreductase subunit NuoK [Candidatus Binatia bacterium]
MVFSPNELNSYLIIGAVLFSLGLLCVLTRRNAISVLMGVELILNSANINYVAFSHFGSGNLDGQIYAMFVIMLAAAEAAVGLAIVLAIFQLFHTIDVEAAETLRE